MLEEHQDGAGRQRPAAGRLPRGLSIPSSASTASPTAAAGQLYQGERTHIGWTAERDRAADHPRQQGQRGHHQGGRHHRTHPRHEVQAGRRPVGPAVAGGARRPADRRVGPVASRSAPRGRASWPARCWAWRARARRSPASCPARSSARATWPTTSSTATSTRSGTANGPRWSTPSPPTRSSGPSTPRSAPRACGPTATAGRGDGVLPAATARRWTTGPWSPGPSGTTTTSCRPSSTP